MIYQVAPSRLSGSIRIPGSKSHTIRALICALYADGESVIRHPLISADTLSARKMVEDLGAIITDEGNIWRVRGGAFRAPGKVIDVGNSGTALYFGIAAGAIPGEPVSFDGDAQIRKRSAQPMIDALVSLGVRMESANGCTPVLVKGPIHGGRCSVKAVTSQYLSALLLAATFAETDVEIEVPLLNERPYVEMTLHWLKRCGVKYTHDDMRVFRIQHGQKYLPFDVTIPSDFSSASFFIVGAAIAGGPVTLEGLDYADTQGDKRVADIMREMGARVEISGGSITIEGPLGNGGAFDLNEIPDSLPILSVAGCFAPGKTVLHNVAHARIKETDRIAVMCAELNRVGAKISEMDDGLAIEYSPITGGDIDGHDDHRVIMSGAIAGCASARGVTIQRADAVSVTFPEFAKLLRSCGGNCKEL